MIKRGFRIRKTTDFSKTYKFGNSYNTTNFYIKSLKTNYNLTKFAVVVPKKAINKAVVRNRQRRRLYEIVRKNINNMQPGYIIIITVKSDLNPIKDTQLTKNLLDGFKKLGLLKK